MMKSPIIIGGTGGSGTRLVAQLVQQSDIYIGSRLNDSIDALDLVGFYDDWINVLLKEDIFSQEYDFSEILRDVFSNYLARFLGDVDADIDWGWKNPRSMFLLPFFESYFTEAKFLHVIRDGRDMAYSKNQNQLDKHGKYILNKAALETSRENQSMYFWAEANSMVADFGEKHMGERYFRIRYEDLCANQKQSRIMLGDFLGVTKHKVEELVAIHVTSNSIGRWKNYQDNGSEDLTEIASDALKRFSYIKN